MTRVLMVVAQRGFRDEEFFEPEEIFKESGYTIDVASLTTQEAVGMLGGRVTPNVSVKDAKIYEYDAVVFAGGKGALTLAAEKDVITLVKNANDRHKIIGAICLAPLILANAGILKGKKATVFETRDTLRAFEKEGVKYTKEEVVVDGRIITSDGPSSSRKFGRTIAKMLI